MKAFISGGVTGNSQELGNMADVANAETEQLVVIYDVLVCERGQFERDIIGFDHGVLGLAVNTALGPGFLRQNTSAYRPRCFVFRSQSLGLCWQPSPAHHDQNLKLTTIGSDNGLSPGQRQNII